MRKCLLLCLLLCCGCTKAQTTSYEIEEKQAKQIVLEHANVSENDITKLEIEKDTEDNTDVYTLKFSTDSKTYEYLVNRMNGEILKSSYESKLTTKNDVSNNSTDKENSSNSNTADTTDKNTTNSSDTKDTSSNNTSETKDTSTNQATEQNQNASTKQSSTSSSITKEQAKTIALSHANIDISDTRMFRIIPEYDDGIAVYDVEFYANNKEYDYEIAQSDGRIISYDYDIEGYTPPITQSNTTNNSSNQSNIIALTEAKSLVLAKVSGASEQDLHISLDYDDGKPVYEGEVYYGNIEYEFEIDATTGNFIEWSMDD